MPLIRSIQIGQPRDLGDPASDDPMDRPWRSGFFKLPIDGPARVERETIVGDGVADRVNHGGPDKAVLGYSFDHFATWQRELGMDALPIGGAFGENLTIADQTEADVCVGDVYAIGDTVTLEVSQPRQPCWKLGRRWRIKELPQRVIQTGRTGWYFRVRTLGTIEAGDALRPIMRPFPALTIAVLNDMMYGRHAVSEDAIACPALSASWREHFQRSRDSTRS